MAQVMTLLAARRTAAAKTSQPPKVRWGMKMRMSTRKASRARRKVGTVRISMASKYLGEWEGECR